jgi:hypothetical protein
MGKCEKCPFNLGIETVEDVVKGFSPEVLNDPNSDATRMHRYVSMARAAFESAVSRIECDYNPDDIRLVAKPAEQGQQFSLETAITNLDESAPFDDTATAPLRVVNFASDVDFEAFMNENSAEPEEILPVPATQQPAEVQDFMRIFGGGAQQQPAQPACMTHYQMALTLLSVNNPSGPDSVYPNGHKTLNGSKSNIKIGFQNPA